jgi:hypothetical protein
MNKTKLPRLLCALLPVLVAGCAGVEDVDPASRAPQCASQCADNDKACKGTNKQADIVSMCNERYQSCLRNCPPR